MFPRPVRQPQATVNITEDASWLALVGVSLPVGGRVHPTVFARLKADLEQHLPAFEHRADGVRICCNVVGTDQESAEISANQVARRVLGMLSLDRSSLTEFTVTHFESARSEEGSTFQNLRLLPPKHD
jgi:hypothetical protein